MKRKSVGQALGLHCARCKAQLERADVIFVAPEEKTRPAGFCPHCNGAVMEKNGRRYIGFKVDAPWTGPKAYKRPVRLKRGQG